jgi:hypothetical protein
MITPAVSPIAAQESSMGEDAFTRRLRREAKRQGLHLSFDRRWGYVLTDKTTNRVVFGGQVFMGVEYVALYLAEPQHEEEEAALRCGGPDAVLELRWRRRSARKSTP